MIVHVYNRTYDDISYEGLNLDGDIKFEAGEILSGGPYSARFAHYCLGCNSTLIGNWEFYSFYASGRYASEDIIETAFEEGKIFSNKEISTMATVRKMIPYGDFEEYIDTKMHEHLKKQQEIAKKVISYRKEFFKFVSLKSCPVCGHKLDGWYYDLEPVSNVSFTEIGGTISKSHENTKSCYLEDIKLSYILNPPSPRADWKYFSWNDFEIQEYFENISRESLNEEMSEYYEDKPIKVNQGVALQSPDDIKEYLKQCLNIENNIFSLRQRFKELYPLFRFAGMDTFASAKIALKESSENITNNISLISKQYDKLKSEDPTKGISVKNFEIAKPEKPIAPRRPTEPILKKPGLFNKKKVLAENELAMKNYNDNVAIFETEHEKYQVQLKDYQLEIKKIKNQELKNYESAISKLKKEHEEKCDELLNELNRSKKELAEFKNNTDSIETPEKTKFELISLEKEEAEKLLKQYLDARAKLYSNGVLFEKYFCDIVAISSFYEYFASGRCEKLTGADGAYNIYENEVRMNTIISKLDQVVESLEQIKKNQYMIYTAISETNKQLASLNITMNTALYQISQTNYKLSEIANNTKVIAYNTERTAFYAQKNAELTNALGYLVALS